MILDLKFYFLFTYRYYLQIYYIIICYNFYKIIYIYLFIMFLGRNSKEVMCEKTATYFSDTAKKV